MKKGFAALILLLPILSNCEKTHTNNNSIILSITLDSIMDIDSNYYQTALIGNSVWMTTDLQTKHFGNGDPIPSAETNTDWQEDSEKYCYYNNNSNAKGLLYNVQCINDSRGIAPIGWHVATERDWQELERFIGMEKEEIEKYGWRGSYEGRSLKSTQSGAWAKTSETEPTNSTGFFALPVGARLFDGSWATPANGCQGFWWASSVDGRSKATYRYLDHKSNGIFRDIAPKGSGFAIRCVKNK